MRFMQKIGLRIFFVFWNIYLFRYNTKTLINKQGKYNYQKYDNLSVFNLIFFFVELENLR